MALRTLSVMADVKIAIAIPVHNRRETTLAGLRSLMQTDQRGLDVRIVVVDDGSTDGTGDAIRAQFPHVEVVEGDGTLHYSAGTNLAIETALAHQPDYVVAMNDDAIFDVGVLQALVACAQAHPRSHVGALLTQQGRPGYAFQVGQQWRTRYGGWHVPRNLRVADLPETPFRVEAVVGNCVLVPAAAIREVGVQARGRHPIGWGDAEWSVRLGRAGWAAIIAPAARVDCEPNTLPASLASRGARGAAKALFLDRRHPLNLRWQWSVMYHTAPGKWRALAAFVTYVVRMSVKAAGFGRWPAWADPPLRYLPA